MIPMIRDAFPGRFNTTDFGVCVIGCDATAVFGSIVDSVLRSILAVGFISTTFPQYEQKADSQSSSMVIVAPQ